MYASARWYLRVAKYTIICSSRAVFFSITGKIAKNPEHETKFLAHPAMKGSVRGKHSIAASKLAQCSAQERQGRQVPRLSKA